MDPPEKIKFDLIVVQICKDSILLITARYKFLQKIKMVPNVMPFRAQIDQPFLLHVFFYKQPGFLSSAWSCLRVLEIPGSKLFMKLFIFQSLKLYLLNIL